MAFRDRWRRVVLRGLLPLLALALAGCGSRLPQNVFNPKGTVAREQLELLSFSMWMAIVILVAVTAITLYTVWRFRARAGQTGEPKQVHGSTRLEIAWTLIPIVILAFLAVPTVKMAFAQAAPQVDALKVRAIGAQWWWGFEYPELGFATANELRIPVGRKVALELISNDVIHSLWVPNLAGKTDVIPGRVNTMWLDALEPGVYFGQCAEFCGESHALMRFRVRALPQQEFDEWVAGRKARQAQPLQVTGAAVQGQELFLKGKICFSCHAIDNTTAKGKVGPDLTDLGSRETIVAGWLENNAENLKKWIQSPQSVKPGAKMTAFPDLTPAELDALVAYLQAQK